MSMTSIFQKNKAIFAVAVFIAATLPSYSSAQETVSFSVSPTIYDMTANPEQVWQSTVRIINPNPFELTLSITPSNFIPKDEDGIPQFVPLKEGDVAKDTLAEWIETEQEIKIPAEKTYELPFKISVPQGATPGGHYAALMISTKPGEGSGNGQVQTSQIISALLFLRVTGDITESSTIRSFRTANYFLSKPETRFEIRVENKGNVHMQPQGEIKIFNMWGRERGTIPINQQTMLGNVLPQSVRKFSFEWKSEWALSDIGRYTAKATLAYGVDERQFISADTAFWIIPWKILLVLFLVLGSLIATITWAMKLYIRHVLTLAGVAPAPSEVKDLPVEKKRTPTKNVLTTKAVTAPIGVSILDLRSQLKKADGPWRDTVMVYINFVKKYWKFFAGFGAVLLLVAIIVWFIVGALSNDRAYQVTDPISGDIIATSDQEDSAQLQNGLGLPITLVNRTTDTELVAKVAETAIGVGFTIATTTTEAGAPEEKTVIVYNPEVSDQALLLSRTLNNALLSAFTSTGTSTEKIVVYVGNDAIEKK
jgi:LytR cell envelope-related transcriptional attenuator